MKLVAPLRGFTVLVTHSPTLPTDIRIRPIFLAFTLLASYEQKRRGWKGKQEKTSGERREKVRGQENRYMGQQKREKRGIRRNEVIQM